MPCSAASPSARTPPSSSAPSSMRAVCGRDRARADSATIPRGQELLYSLPERLVRSVAAVVGGGVHETAELVLPRLVRRSRLYEATAQNLLRVTVELVGGVEQRDPTLPEAGEIAVRKGGGNAVELGSIAAFGFSPLWLLAAASDVAHGTRTLPRRARRRAQKAAGILAQETNVGRSRAAGRARAGSGTAAALIDVPPLELAELRASLSELRGARARCRRRRSSRRPSPACAPQRGARAAVAARGLAGRRARLPALRPDRLTRAPRHAVPRGLAAAPGTGLRRVRRRIAGHTARRSPGTRRGAPDVHGADSRALVARRLSRC